MAYFVPGLGVVGDVNQRQDTSGRATNLAGSLYPKGKTSEDGLKFQLNPSQIQRRRMAQYTESGAAEADYWQDYEGPSPLQWVRNPPEQISFELMMYATGDDNVESQLSKLRAMKSRSGNAPRGSVPGPPDLVFKYGPRADVVRIMTMTVTEELHNSKLEVQQARVQLELKTVSAGSR